MSYSKLQVAQIDTREQHQQSSDHAFNRENMIGVLKMVTSAVTDMATATVSIFSDFQGAMKTILPKLNDSEKELVYAAFGEYHSLLLITQQFLTRTLIRTRRAETTMDLLQSIDARKIKELIDQVVPLLQRFWRLNSLIDEKVKDERSIKWWRNITLAITAIGAGVLIIGTGFGVALGFTVVLKSVLILSAAATITSVSAAAIAHAAQKLSVFEQVINNLRELSANLTQLSQNYSNIEAMGDLLSIGDNSKQEFIDILNKTQEEINKGFNILKKI